MSCSIKAAGPTSKFLAALDRLIQQLAFSAVSVPNRAQRRKGTEGPVKAADSHCKTFAALACDYSATRGSQSVLRTHQLFVGLHTTPPATVRGFWMRVPWAMAGEG